MVPGLPPLLDHRHRRARVYRRAREDRLEVLLVDVVRARAGDQAPPRPKQPQRPQVDLLVAAAGLLHRVLALGERGGIEDHGVEALTPVVEVVQEVEDVGVAHDHVGQPVPLRVRLQPLDRLRGDVRRQDPGGHRGHLEGEAALVGEAVQDAPAGVGPGRGMVLALVEEEAGLLAVVEVGQVRDPVLLHLDRRGDGPVEQADLRFQPFELAHLGVVALEDPLRLEQLPKRVHDLALAPVHTLGERLHDEVVAVAVDHQGGEAIALAVDHAVGGGARGHRLAPAQRRGQPLAEEASSQGLAALHHAEADLRPRRVEGEAEGPALRPLHAHQRARGDAPVARHVRTEDPGVAALDARLALAADDDRTFDRRALGHLGGSPSGFFSGGGPGAAGPGVAGAEGAGDPWGAGAAAGGEGRAAQGWAGGAAGAGGGAKGDADGSPCRADPGLMLPSTTAPSWTERRLARIVPRTRAVGNRLSASALISPLSSPSTSTVAARTLARACPLGPRCSRPRSSMSPSSRPRTSRSLPTNRPENEASSPITAVSLPIPATSFAGSAMGSLLRNAKDNPGRTGVEWPP